MMNSFSLSLACGMCVVLVCVTAAHAQTPTPAAQDAAEIASLKTRAERAEASLRDWAQLSRYDEANNRLIASKAKTRVVFIGDSITDQWDDADRGGFFTGKPYANRGIGGQITPQMLIRFFPDVIALEPEAVVILGGTNDIQRAATPETTRRIRDNLTAMAELARAHRIKVIFASLLPVHDNGRDREGKPVPRTDRRPPAQLREVNAWMKDYAARNGHTYLDYHTALVTPQGLMREELSGDGLHVNAKGYAIMLPLAEAAIAKALNERRLPEQRPNGSRSR